MSELGPERPEARPYLAHRAPVDPDRATAPADESVVDAGVRPYLLTGGRTRAANEAIGFETMVTITPSGIERLAFETTERKAILTQANPATSVVEASGRLRLPLGVVQVLTGDLADDGLLDVHHAPTEPAKDPQLLERLVLAVQAKQKEL